MMKSNYFWLAVILVFPFQTEAHHGVASTGAIGLEGPGAPYDNAIRLVPLQ